MQTPLSVFYVAVEKIDPNPFQPRKIFDDAKLDNLAQSIRRYGVLQPLVVTQKKVEHGEGASSRYELIAGERRLRASRLAGLREVPVVIRTDIQDDTVRLELAIIENLQRVDLNPVDRARAFKQLVEGFNMTQTEVASKMGMSREYVSNSLRLLTLPEEIVRAVSEGKISEGHTRPLLMLSERPEEQKTLFEEIMLRKITVREAELIARKYAVERSRAKKQNPEIESLETQMSSLLNARVHIRSNGQAGGKIVIDYFSDDELQNIAETLKMEHSEDVAVPEQESDPDEEGDMYSFRNFSL